MTAEVFSRRSDTDWAEVKPGQALTTRDELQTGAESSVTVELSDGSVVNMGQLTQLRISELRSERSRTQVRVLLKMGEVTAKLKRQETVNSDFSIKMPTATAGIRGSAMTVAYDPSSQVTSVAVTEDKAYVQRLAFRLMSPGTEPIGDWTPGPPTAAEQTVLQGETLRVSTRGVTVDDLSRAIPAARTMHFAYLSATVPGRISLATLARSRCVRIDVAASHSQTAVLRISAGHRTFAARLLGLGHGERVLCIRVPRFARRLKPGTALTITLDYPNDRRARYAIRRSVRLTR